MRRPCRACGKHVHREGCLLTRPVPTVLWQRAFEPEFQVQLGEVPSYRRRIEAPTITIRKAVIVDGWRHVVAQGINRDVHTLGTFMDFAEWLKHDLRQGMKNLLRGKATSSRAVLPRS